MQNPTNLRAPRVSRSSNTPAPACLPGSTCDDTRSTWEHPCDARFSAFKIPYLAGTKNPPKDVTVFQLIAVSDPRELEESG